MQGVIRKEKSFIIFICKENPFKGKSLHKYTFSNLCHEKAGLELGDETVKIFLTPDSKANDISGEIRAKKVGGIYATTDF